MEPNRGMQHGLGRFILLTRPGDERVGPQWDLKAGNEKRTLISGNILSQYANSDWTQSQSQNAEVQNNKMSKSKEASKQAEESWRESKPSPNHSLFFHSLKFNPACILGEQWRKVTIIKARNLPRSGERTAAAAPTGRAATATNWATTSCWESSARVQTVGEVNEMRVVCTNRRVGLHGFRFFKNPVFFFSKRGYRTCMRGVIPSSRIV